jgi:hypothetical protein
MEQMATASEKLYDANATVNYTMRLSSFPRLSGHPLDPNFVYQFSDSEYSPAVTAEPTLALTVTNRGPSVSGTHTLSVNAPVSEATQCFVSSNQGNPRQAPHSPNFDHQCHQNWPDSLQNLEPPINTLTYMVVQVEGTSLGSHQLASGEVAMKYRIGSGDWRELGSRRINGPGQANFVPRGTPPSFVPSQWMNPDDDPYYPEFSLYQGLTLRYGTNIRFRFTLTSNNNHTISWRPTRIRIFTPKFSNQQQQNLSCSSPVSKANAEQNMGCVLQPPLPSHVSYSVNLSNPQTPVALGSPIQLGCTITSNPDFFELADFGVSNQNEFQFNFNNHPSCQLTNRLANCPAIGESFPAGAANVGVPQAPDNQGFISGSSQALLICPPNGPDLEASLAQPQNIKWSENWSSIPGFASYLWPSSGCLDSGPSYSQLPATLKQYHKLNLGEPVADTEIFSAHFTADLDPQELKANDPQYSCDEVKLVERLFNTHQPGVTPTSIFHGLRPQLGCAWKEALKAEATTIGMNQEAYFKPHQPVAGSLFTIPQEPSEPCISYQIDPGSSSHREVLGVFEEGQFPNSCFDGTSICQAQFVGFGPGEPQEIGYDFELAAQSSGYAAVKAAMPRVDFGCEGKNCVNLNLSQDGPHIFSSGQIEIPLLLLMQNTVKLKYNETRRLESDFVK